MTIVLRLLNCYRRIFFVTSLSHANKRVRTLTTTFRSGDRWISKTRMMLPAMSVQAECSHKEYDHFRQTALQTAHYIETNQQPHAFQAQSVPHPALAVSPCKPTGKHFPDCNKDNSTLAKTMSVVVKTESCFY